MKKIFISVIIIAVLIFGFSQVKAASIVELQAQLKSLLNQLSVLQAKLASLQAGEQPSSCYPFSASLVSGQKGAEVSRLQTFLQQEGFAISADEVQAQYFGPSTKAAVITFQEKNRDEILLPAGLTRGTGVVGIYTRERINARMGCAIGSTMKFCSGFAGIVCPDGLECRLDGNYPDAGGHCVPKAETSTKVCTADVMQCPDGSYVSRVAPSCQFASCPVARNCMPRPACLDSNPRCLIAEPIGGWCPASSTSQVACSMDAKQCPDGSYVGRIPPNCEFAACPTTGGETKRSPSIVSPNSPKTLRSGEQLTISWNANGGQYFDVYYIKNGPTATWQKLWQNTAGSGSTIRSILWWATLSGSREFDVYRFKVCVAGTEYCAESSDVTVLNEGQ